MKPVTPEASGMGPWKASKILIFWALVTPMVEEFQFPEHLRNRVYRDELKPVIPPHGELTVKQRAWEEWVISSHTPLDPSRLSGLPLTHCILQLSTCLFQRGNSTDLSQYFFSQFVDRRIPTRYMLVRNGKRTQVVKWKLKGLSKMVCTLMQV